MVRHSTAKADANLLSGPADEGMSAVWVVAVGSAQNPPINKIILKKKSTALQAVTTIRSVYVEYLYNRSCFGICGG